MNNTATRLITLIFLLQSQPNQKASELAEKLGVSLRTVHRYFAMLDEMGIPVYAERGPYGGFSLVRGYKIPPLIFSLEEAVAVYLGTSLVSEMWGSLYRDAAQGALAKLANILPNEQRSEIEWARRSLVTTSLNRVQSSQLFSVLDDLRKAARDHYCVSLVYQGATEKKAARRKIDPYALVFRSGLWYVVGYCHLRNAPRTFRVDRIEKITLLSQLFEVPQDFDIHHYLEDEFKAQPSIRARLQFIPEAVHIVKSNLRLWESVAENTDGSMEVTLVSPDLPFLASITLSFAHWVTVLEPPELRQMVHEWAQKIANQYENKRNTS